MPSKRNSAAAETAQSKFARREAEIALAMKQESERRAAAVRNMHRLRALRLSLANGQVSKPDKSKTSKPKTSP
jgi:predicted nucleotidyltransferase